MKKLLMIGLEGSLRAVLTYRFQPVSRLQRTKLPSRKHTQDINLFDNGCRT